MDQKYHSTGSPIPLEVNEEPPLAIIVVDFNSPNETFNCLSSIAPFLPSGSKAFLIDNSHTPNYAVGQIEKETKMSVAYEFSGGNIGFAEACNRGLKAAISEGFRYAALLNNDTISVDDSIKRSVKFLEGNPAFSIIGLKNYYLSDPQSLWQAGSEWRVFKLGFRPAQEQSYLEVTPCDYVAGSSLIIRLSTFQHVDFLDRKYFAYYEEVDLCLRFKKSGQLVGILNRSRILHSVGHSSNPTLKTYLKTRNRLFLLQAHIDSSLGLATIGSIFFLRDFLHLFRGAHRSIRCKALFLGVFHFVTGRRGPPPWEDLLSGQNSSSQRKPLT